MRVEHLAENVTLYLGDMLDVVPTLAPVAAVVTDAPFGIKDTAFDSGQRSGKRTGGDNVWHAESTWDVEINPAWIRTVAAAAPTGSAM